MTDPFWTPEKKAEYKKLVQQRDKKRRYHREYNKKARADGRVPNHRHIKILKEIGIDTKGLDYKKALRLLKRYYYA